MAKSGDPQTQVQSQNGTQAATTNSSQQQQEQASQNATSNQVQSGTQQGTQAQTQQGTQVGNQTTTSNPWEAAQPLLKNLIAQYSNVSPAVTGAQTSALTKLNTDASGIPNFGKTGTDAVNNFFTSSTAPQVGMLSTALGQLQNNIGGTASGAELDPYKTPGFSDAISTMTNDITDKVKGVYAGSGRDPSGAGSFAGSLGRGLTQGLAPTIANQFNTNNANRLNAANTLYGAGNTTASNITGQQQVPLTNSAQGIGLAGQLSSLFTNPAAAQLQAANASQALPLSNLAGMLSPLLQLGGLGGTTSGSTVGQTAGTTAGQTTGATSALTNGTTSGTTSGSTSGNSQGTSLGSTTGNSNTTTTQPQNLLSNILGGVAGGAGILSSLGGSGGGLGALSTLFGLSDARAKENIEEVGKLHDGQPVVRFNYKGMPGTQIGLLAQQVREVEPEAVGDFGDTGLLGVNYRRATDRAAAMARAA